MSSTGKSKSKKKSSAIKWWYVVIVVVLSVAGIGVFNTVRHKQNQKLLTKDLVETGVALDALVSELKEEISGIQPERFSDCYRASVKYGVMPINCSQRLVLVQNDLSPDQKLLSSERIDRIVLDFKKLKYTKKSTKDSLTVYSALTAQGTGSCTAVYLEKPGSPEYEFKVDCIFGDFDDFIYPERQ